jgi:hypothetical protein
MAGDLTLQQYWYASAPQENQTAGQVEPFDGVLQKAVDGKASARFIGARA